MIEIENYEEGADSLNMFDIPLDPNQITSSNFNQPITLRQPAILKNLPFERAQTDLDVDKSTSKMTPLKHHFTRKLKQIKLSQA